MSCLNFCCDQVAAHCSLLPRYPLWGVTASCPIQVSCGICCPKPGLGMLMRCPSGPSLCLEEQVSSSGCFWDPVSELPADKEAFVWPVSVPRPGGRWFWGSAHSHTDKCLGILYWFVRRMQGGLRATVYYVAYCFQKEPIVVMVLSIGRLLTNHHHFAGGFSFRSGWEGQKGPLRNSHSAFLFYRWGDWGTEGTKGTPWSIRNLTPERELKCEPTWPLVLRDHTTPSSLGKRGKKKKEFIPILQIGQVRLRDVKWLA